MNNDIPSWLNDLAAEIHSLIKKYDAAVRFKRMVNIYIEKNIKESKDISAWHDKRRRHFEEQVTNNICLQDEKAGPPENNWVWENNRIPVIENNEHKRKFIQGWVPVELSFSNKPEVRKILPLDPKVDYSIEDKYTCLASIYYCYNKGIEKYDIFPEKFDIIDYVSNSLKCIVAECLKRNVETIMEDDKVWLENMLKDLSEDLAEYNPSCQEVNSFSTEIPSSIKDTRWYTKKGNRKYIFIFIGGVVLIAMLASVGTEIPSWINNIWEARKQKSHDLMLVKTQINRFIEDCNLSVEKNASEFSEESARMAQSVNMSGMFSSGAHIKMQWKTAIDYRMNIDEAYRILIRNLEDLLLKHFDEKDIYKNPELKEEAEKIESTFESCENAKKKIEDHVRKIDLRVHKDHPTINDKFELRGQKQ